MVLNLLSISQSNMISATPVSYMLKLVLSGVPGDAINFFNLEPSDDYVGIEDLTPLSVGGEQVYLEQDELKPSSDIPYANDKVFDLYNDAVSRRGQTRGVLLLDVSSPWVTARGNVMDKASAVQEKLLNDKGVGKFILKVLHLFQTHYFISIAFL